MAAKTSAFVARAEVTTKAEKCRKNCGDVYRAAGASSSSGAQASSKCAVSTRGIKKQCAWQLSGIGGSWRGAASRRRKLCQQIKTNEESVAPCMCSFRRVGKCGGFARAPVTSGGAWACWLARRSRGWQLCVVAWPALQLSGRPAHRALVAVSASGGALNRRRARWRRKCRIETTVRRIAPGRRSSDRPSLLRERGEIETLLRINHAGTSRRFF